MPITSKLPQVGTTIFTVMSQLAQQHQAINLSQGFPDFSSPPELIAHINAAMLAGHNQYAPMIGLPTLRQAIAEKTALLYTANINSETEITLTSGATEALFCAITAVVKPGDEVIIFDPAYDAYEPVITLSGGKTVRIPMRYPDYHIDWDEVQTKINTKTRLIIINSPHNPTGTVLQQQDINQLLTIVNQHDIFILSDEVYEHIIFDGKPHLSMLHYEALRARSFVVSSFGKTYHCTGWKLGYCIAPPALSAEFRKIHQYVVFSTCTPMQYALAEFLKERVHYLTLSAFYQGKRDYFLQKIAASRFRPLACNGTYFQLLNYSDITDTDDYTYARQLIETARIAAIPISVFFGNKRDNRVLRFCFAKDTPTLDKAAEILCAI